jgi:Asp-tRNA(Asn)/Glu-tRNA(Gln) amidotransferase A subunit family amidase
LGSTLFADAAPDTTDDIVVSRLKAAGAIVIGKSNTPAFGHTAVTNNAVFGATRNPWNVDRSPGGSSGGSAAALAAGMVPLATTSDGGGSVRIPASLCGLVGYNPTNGAIGRSVLPRWLEFSTMGCSGSTVADVLLEADVVLGAVAGDVISIPRSGIHLETQRPRRLLACRTLRGGVDTVIATAFDDGCRALAEALGVEVTYVEPPTADATVPWFVMATAELAQSLAEHRARWDDVEPSLRQMLEFGEAVTTADYIAAARSRWAVCRVVDELLGDDAVLLTPTVNATSWRPEGPLPTSAGGVDDPGIAVNTADFNFTSHPAVSVPLGRDDDGVPFGLQIVAPRCRDGLALGVAQAWEQVAPWPATADGYDPFGAQWL